ncbi:MAG TPA: PDZ domain-containing protein [Puia sp.]|nr:PDZ domain-containing protein [Puia sp.]
MKQYLLKASGMAALVFILYSKSIAQDTPPPPPPPVIVPDGAAKVKSEEKIVIKKKNDKDIKITVEVKDGKVFINGKPSDDYHGDDVTIEKRIGEGPDADAFVLTAPDGNMNIRTSPFRNWSYNGEFPMKKMFNAAFLGVSSENYDGKGAKITDITENSGAEKAGLQKDDIIIKINDIKIEGPSQLTEAIHKFKPEDKVTVTYIRDGKERQVVATLGKNAAFNYTGTYNFKMPDMDMSGLSNLDRIYAPRAFSYSWNTDRPKLGIKAQDTEDGKGVKVLDVDDESPAEKAGIKEGDIITQFDGKTVNSAESLANLARENRNKISYKINLTRDGASKEVEIKIPKKLKTADL